MNSSAQRVQLVFAGEVLAGFQDDEVKRQLGALLKIGPAQQDQLFSGTRTVLKKSIDPQEAQRYVDYLAKLGAKVHIEALEAPAAVAAAPAVVAAADAVPPVEEITCPNCGLRQPKQVFCRECVTNMPMGIAAKEEAEREAREARQAERQARLGGKPQASAITSSAAGGAGGMFSFGGRIARLPYFTVGGFVTAMLVGLLTFFISHPHSLAAGLVFVAFAVFALFMTVRLAILRLHDINNTGWWCLLLFVPYVGGVAGMVLALWPGNGSDNDYGEPPRPGHIGLALLAALAFGSSLYQAGKTLSSSEMLSTAMSWGQRSDEQADSLRIEDFLSSREGVRAFHEKYEAAGPNKAFAVSADGVWGWHADANTPAAAAGMAMRACDQYRKPGGARCKLLNFNGRWMVGTRGDADSREPEAAPQEGDGGR